MNVLKEHPTPWKVIKIEFGAWIEDSYGKTIVTTRGRMFDHQVLEFIAEAVNNSVRPQITDVECKCDCGWRGTVVDTESDIDGDGSLLCPECLNIVRAIV